jgi:hypothetical protein
MLFEVTQCIRTLVVHQHMRFSSEFHNDLYTFNFTNRSGQEMLLDVTQCIRTLVVHQHMRFNSEFHNDLYTFNFTNR